MVSGIFSKSSLLLVFLVCMISGCVSSVTVLISVENISDKQLAELELNNFMSRHGYVRYTLTADGSERLKSLMHDDYEYRGFTALFDSRISVIVKSKKFFDRIDFLYTERGAARKLSSDGKKYYHELTEALKKYFPGNHISDETDSVPASFKLP